MNRELLKVCGIALFHFTTVDLLSPLVPQYAARLNLSPGMIGVLVSLYAFIPFLLAVPGGVLTDRFGTRRVLVVGIFTVISAPLLFALSGGVLGLFTAEILAGLGHFMMMVAIQAHVSLLAVNPDQGFGFFTFAGSMGTTMGPVIGGLIADRVGFQAAFLAGAGFAAVASVFVLALRPIATPANGRRVSLQSSLAHLRGFISNRGIIMAMSGSIAMLFTMGLVQSFYPLYLEGRGLTPATIGLLISIASVAATFVRLVLFKSIAVWGRRRLFAVALVMGAVGTGIVPLMGSFALLALAAVVTGLGRGMSQPLSMIIVANSTGGDERGLAMGFRLMGNRLGWFLSPLSLGLVATFFPMNVLFYIAAAVPLGAAIMTITWVRQEPRLRATNRTGVSSPAR